MRYRKGAGRFAEVSFFPILGSVSNVKRVAQSIPEHGVQVVSHAAAHKHVPLVEANSLKGIKNNVFGTPVSAEVAFDNGVRDFVLISTDKAVCPTNVMGATKRWVELNFQQKASLAAERKASQWFCAMRFGKVLGSSRSVVTLSKEQIALGDPLTLTGLSMACYFMSIHDAAELILRTGALSSGRDVFLLDREPVMVADLAENMIQLIRFSVRLEETPMGASRSSRQTGVWAKEHMSNFSTTKPPRPVHGNPRSYGRPVPPFQLWTRYARNRVHPMIGKTRPSPGRFCPKSLPKATIFIGIGQACEL